MSAARRVGRRMRGPRPEPGGAALSAEVQPGVTGRCARGIGAGARTRSVLLSLLVLLPVLDGCAARAPRVRESWVTGIFGDLLKDSTLGGVEPAATRFRAAWDRVQAGELEAPRRAFEELRAAPPYGVPEAGLYPVYTALGAIHLAGGEEENALRFFRKALDLKPASTEALVGTAAVGYLRGDDEDARDLADKVLALEPGHPGALSLRGRLVPRMQEALLEEANAAEERGDPTTALDRISRAAALAPDDAAMRMRQASLAAAAGDFPGAVSAAREAARLLPSDPEAWLLLGESQLKAGEPEAAREAYEQAAKLPGGLERAQGRVRALRESSRQAPAPPSLQEALRAEALDRAGLAALVQRTLPMLSRVAPAGDPVIVTDISRSGARAAIQDAIALGVMEVYDNHTFRPAAPVSRAMLARTAAGILRQFRRSGWLSERRYDTRVIADVPPEHLAYPDVVEALRYGVMDLDGSGGFRPAEVVAGEEALRVLESLAGLAQ